MSVINAYLDKLSQGKVKGHQAFNKFGEVDDVDTGTTPEDIQIQGGLIAFVPVAELCTIVSLDADDNATGTGCQQVQIFGVNGVGSKIEYREEIVSMNGTTPVVLQNNYRAIYRMRNVKSGTSAINEGRISVVSNDTSTELAVINPLTGSTLTSFFAVAAEHEVYLYNIYADIGRGQSTTARSAIISLRELDIINNAERVINEFRVSSSSPLIEEFKPRIRIKENHYIWVRVEEVSGNDTNIRCNYGFELAQL